MESPNQLMREMIWSIVKSRQKFYTILQNFTQSTKKTESDWQFQMSGMIFLEVVVVKLPKSKTPLQMKAVFGNIEI